MITPLHRHNCSRTLMAALAAAAAMSIASCTSNSNDQSPPSTEATAPPPPATNQVGAGTGLADVSYVELDRTVFHSTISDDPSSVLTDGLATAFSWRPATDSNGWDAIVRSHTAWNNSYLRAQEMRLTTLVSLSSRDWQSWGDRSQVFAADVQITAEEHPADTDTDYARVVKIVLSTTGGSRPDLSRPILTLITNVRMHKTEDLGWRIDSFDVKDTVLPEVQSS